MQQRRLGAVMSRIVVRTYYSGRQWKVGRVVRVLERSDLQPGDLIVTTRQPGKTQQLMSLGARRD